MAGTENIGFLQSLSLGNPAERYKPHPPCPRDFEPWHESERSAHDQFSSLVCIMQETVRAGRSLRNVKGVEAEYEWVCDVFRCMKQTIKARLAGWQPRDSKGN
jgi:hypothetical protein